MLEADKSPRVVTVMPGDIPGLISAMSAGDRRAGQLLPPALKLATHIRSKRGRGSTCPCCRGKIRGPFATALIYRAGSAESSSAAAFCADCGGTAEEATAAGEALARISHKAKVRRVANAKTRSDSRHLSATCVRVVKDGVFLAGVRLSPSGSLRH